MNETNGIAIDVFNHNNWHSSFSLFFLFLYFVLLLLFIRIEKKRLAAAQEKMIFFCYQNIRSVIFWDEKKREKARRDVVAYTSI